LTNVYISHVNSPVCWFARAMNGVLARSAQLFVALVDVTIALLHYSAASDYVMPVFTHWLVRAERAPLHSLLVADALLASLHLLCLLKPRMRLFVAE
jgi:hypothetical protein